MANQEEPMKPKNNIEGLKKAVRKMTKLIGMATTNNDFGEATNLRQQRSSMLKQLIDLGVYYWVEDGKSKFGTLEEAEEFFSDEERANKAKGAIMAAELVGSWNSIRNRRELLNSLTPEKAKATVLEDLDKEIGKLEKAINGINEKIGKKAIDFAKIKEGKEHDGIDGIDWSSLI